MKASDVERMVKIAADSLATLRRSDVMRVLEDNGMNLELADYIAKHRPDLAVEVGECLSGGE